MLPVVVVLVALVAQMVLLVRDELHLLHAARTASRAAVIDPRPSAVRAALTEAGLQRGRLEVRVSGSQQPGQLVVVELRTRPTRVPLVGLVVSRMVLRERMTAMVE